MNDPADVVLVGRSSSHFTRTARIFALALDVPHSFRPVFDLTTTDPAAYAGNPALKIPVLVDSQGPLFGTENICRELARRAPAGRVVIQRGDVANRLVVNAEELVLHAMNTGVALIMAGVGAVTTSAPSKLRRSLENALAFLDANVAHILAALPADRTLSFCETTLFCAVTHLPFRGLLETSSYAGLQRFCATFGQRPSARATEYCFDVPASAPEGRLV